MNILEEIITHKEYEVKMLKQVFQQMGRVFDMSIKRDFRFYEALQKQSALPKVIAEIKPRSPSRGQIFRKGDTVESITHMYDQFGVAAISVLTDTKFFGASMDNLVAARGLTDLPLLLKDFVIDEVQIHDACEHGADAVLLMRSVLDTETIQYFLDILSDRNMDALVEVHDKAELFDVLENTTARIIGINNRDLKTLEVNPTNFNMLLESIPQDLMKDDLIFVCESGLKNHGDVRQYAKNADAVLVGTGILTAARREETLLNIIGRPQVKICGITNLEDANAVAEQANAIGFLFAEESPRFIQREKAKEIATALRDEYFSAAPKIVGVFVNPTLKELEQYDFLDAFQLHGEETAEFCAEVKKSFPGKEVWKALQIKTEKDLEQMNEFINCDVVLLDAFSPEVRGGSGETIDLELLKKIPEYAEKDQKFFIAGGISAENVSDIVAACLPDGVDLVSSVEREKGVKDLKKLDAFFKTIQEI